MKILFACDLDGTLIHSYKNRLENDICVEIYDGREQSLISPREFELLKRISEKILFIPVTTRSIAQYQRIFFPENFFPSYAVVSNGSYLLNNGNLEDFLRKLVEPYYDELKIQFKKYSEAEEFDICRIVDENFLFLRCRDDIDAEKMIFDTKLTVQNNGQKIYLFPPQLNKGEALKLLIKKFSPEKIIAAGDSNIDLPMLELADVAFYKKNICNRKFLRFSTAGDFLELIATKIK